MEMEYEPPEIRCRVFRGDSQGAVLEAMVRWDQREDQSIETMTMRPPSSDVEGDETFTLTVYYGDKNA